MLSNALRGLKIGLFAGACYWFVDTMVMFAVLEWKMSSPSSGLVPESFWLFVASLAIYGGLGLLAGAAMGALPGGLLKPVESLWQKLRAKEGFSTITAGGPLKGLTKLDDSLPIQVVLLALIPMHILVLLVSPEFDDIMGVGFLILHLGLALFVVLSVIYLLQPLAMAFLVLALMGGWVRFQDKGAIATMMGGDGAGQRAEIIHKASATPNVVWFVADTTRADHLSISGYKRDTTPFLAEKAASGVVFDNAYATAPWTLASHAGMFSGKYSSRSHATHETLFLAFENSTLAEVLEGAGYDTLLMAGNPWLQDFTGLAQGFQHVFPSWRSYTIAQVFVLGRAYEQYVETAQDKGARSSNDKAQAWLSRRQEDRPFFWFFNYLEPHAPYHQIPNDYAMMYQADGVTLDEVDQVSRNIMSDMMFSTGYVADERSLEIALANYDGGIRYTDEKIKEVVEMIGAAGELENTLFIFSADHGELFGKDGIWGHELSLDEALIHVPLMMWGAGVPAQGVRVTSPVQLLDVIPTLVEVIGAPDAMPEGNQGRSLMQTIDAPEVEGAQPRPIFAEYFTPSHPSLKDTARALGMDPDNLRIRTVKIGDLKYVAGPGDKKALFNVANDPEERTNIYDDYLAEAATFASLLEGFVLDAESGAIGGEGGAPEMDAATRQRLCDLGYLECE